MRSYLGRIKCVLVHISCAVLLIIFVSFTGCYYTTKTTSPPVEFESLSIPEGIESGHPFRQGLDPDLLPPQLADKSLREDTVFVRTTEYGFRAVLAMYDRIVVMLWKAPTDEDLESGIIFGKETEPINEKGAADFMRGIMEGTTDEPGAYYSKDLVTASKSDEDGLKWFTTEGISTLLWQVPRSERTSFWFRTGNWFFGIEADTIEERNKAAKDLVFHLKNISKMYEDSE